MLVNHALGFILILVFSRPSVIKLESIPDKQTDREASPLMWPIRNGTSSYIKNYLQIITDQQLLTLGLSYDMK